MGLPQLGEKVGKGKHYVLIETREGQIQCVGLSLCLRVLGPAFSAPTAAAGRRPQSPQYRQWEVIVGPNAAKPWPLSQLLFGQGEASHLPSQCPWWSGGVIGAFSPSPSGSWGWGFFHLLHILLAGPGS